MWICNLINSKHSLMCFSCKFTVLFFLILREAFKWHGPDVHASQWEGCWFNPCIGQGLSLWSLHVWVHSTLMSEYKLLLGMSVSMDGCLSLYVALWLAGNLFRVYPTSCLMCAGMGSRPLLHRKGWCCRWWIDSDAMVFYSCCSTKTIGQCSRQRIDDAGDLV